jgi:glucan phosphorylase
VNIHGGLNLSILDGWWSEGYDESNGWAIGDRSNDDGMDVNAQDDRDADRLYTVLESQVLPAFYNRNEHGIPEEWLRMMRSAMSGLTYRFSAHRMITDYANQIYNVERFEEVL